MLNLTQRLLLGCVVIAALAVGLVAITHRALAAAGDSFISVAFIVSIVLVEIATVILVLHPIKMLADDAKKIASGNLEHRVEWSSRDDFGVIAGEMNRIAVRLRDLRDSGVSRRSF